MYLTSKQRKFGQAWVTKPYWSTWACVESGDIPHSVGGAIWWLTSRLYTILDPHFWTKPVREKITSKSRFAQTFPCRKIGQFHCFPRTNQAIHICRHQASAGIRSRHPQQALSQGLRRHEQTGRSSVTSKWGLARILVVWLNVDCEFTHKKTELSGETHGLLGEDEPTSFETIYWVFDMMRIVFFLINISSTIAMKSGCSWTHFWTTVQHLEGKLVKGGSPQNLMLAIPLYRDVASLIWLHTSATVVGEFVPLRPVWAQTDQGKEDCDQLQRLQCHGLIHKKVMLGNYETLGLQWDYNRINHPQISTVDLMNLRVFLSIPFEAPCQTPLLPKPIYSLRVRLTPPASPARHFMWLGTFSTTHLKENGLILLRTNENDLSKCL